MKSIHDKATLYPETMAVLHVLRDVSVKMALASRTPTPHVADAFLDQLGLKPYFCDIQLVPAADGFDQTSAQKDTAHLPNIRAATGIEYRDMLFFDDEARNVQRVGRLGVTSVLVDPAEGLTLAVLLEGLRRHAERRRTAGS